MNQSSVLKAPEGQSWINVSKARDDFSQPNLWIGSRYPKLGSEVSVNKVYKPVCFL